MRRGSRLVLDVRVTGGEGGKEGEEGSTPSDTFVGLQRYRVRWARWKESEERKKGKPTFQRLLSAARPYRLISEVMEDSPTTERSCVEVGMSVFRLRL